MEFRSYGSLDEMLDSMRKDQEAAEGRVASWQNDLKPGDLFVRSAEGVAIYCEVLDPALPADKGQYSQEHLDDLRESAAWYNEPHMKPFRFCRAFSVYCPRGELGDVHISTASAKITPEHFENAKARGWRSSPGNL